MTTIINTNASTFTPTLSPTIFLCESCFISRTCFISPTIPTDSYRSLSVKELIYKYISAKKGRFGRYADEMEFSLMYSAILRIIVSKTSPTLWYNVTEATGKEWNYGIK